MSRPGHPERPPGRVGVRGSLKKPRIKNMTAPLYQHVLADSVAPRIKTLAADWQVWEFAEGATDIEYDGEYSCCSNSSGKHHDSQPKSIMARTSVS